MPLLCVTPTTQAADTTLPIFLAYNQAGPGHYDYAIPASGDNDADTAQIPPRKKAKKCTCGRKAGFSGRACTTSRCACVLKSRGCSTLCTCKNCNNVLGIRPKPSSTRSRISYDTLKQPLSGKPIATFMQSKGDSTEQGNLSVMAVIVFKILMGFFILNGCSLTKNNLLCAYNRILHVSTLIQVVDFTLSAVMEKQVKQCLKRFHVLLELLQTVLLAKS